jgi:hypothetical protein
MSEKRWLGERRPARPNDGPHQEPTPPHVVARTVLVVLGILAAILIVPALVWRLTPPTAPTKARYWLVPRWWVYAVIVGVLAVVALLVWEGYKIAAALPAAIDAGFFSRDVSEWVPAMLLTVLPYWLLNLAAGVLAVPAGWAWKRRRLARAVARRQVDDVSMQEEIERARIRAADLSAASRIGVVLNMEERRPERTKADAITGPHKLRHGYAVGNIARPTIRTFRDRFRDQSKVRTWTDRSNRWLVVPTKAGDIRLIVIAESGQGKTVLLFQMMLAMLRQGMRVVFIDGKGNPKDAAELRAAAAATGSTVAAPPTWNLFQGNAKEITDRITRLFPSGEGDGSFYRKRARTVMQKIQKDGTVRSLDDLRQRVMHPAEYVSDRIDLDYLRSEGGPTKNAPPLGVAALYDIETQYEDMRDLIDTDGWSFDDLPADLTTVTVNTSDDSQKRLADLLLLAYRQHMVKRAESGDMSPLVVVVDEFAQLAGDDTDPATLMASLQETGRSLGVGSILASQSVVGVSDDENSQERLMQSGAGIVVGRTPAPDAAVQYAGTAMRMEASGAASGDQLNSGRAQHTYLLHPQVVREAVDGAFWMIRNGAIAAFRALPPEAAPQNATTATADAPTPPRVGAQVPSPVTPTSPAEPSDELEGAGGSEPAQEPADAAPAALWVRSAPNVPATPPTSEADGQRPTPKRPQMFAPKTTPPKFTEDGAD